MVGSHTPSRRLRAVYCRGRPGLEVRIGELLATRTSEVNLREKRITIREAQKTRVADWLT